MIHVGNFRRIAESQKGSTELAFLTWLESINWRAFSIILQYLSSFPPGTISKCSNLSRQCRSMLLLAFCSRFNEILQVWDFLWQILHSIVSPWVNLCLWRFFCLETTDVALERFHSFVNRLQMPLRSQEKAGSLARLRCSFGFFP